jgi:hypothetical protein
LLSKNEPFLGDEYPTSIDKLHAFVDFYRKNWRSVFSNGGCPLMNAATEADDSFPVLKSRFKIF